MESCCRKKLRSPSEVGYQLRRPWLKTLMFKLLFCSPIVPHPFLRQRLHRRRIEEKILIVRLNAVRTTSPSFESLFQSIFFVRSTVRGVFHVVFNVVCISTTFYLFHHLAKESNVQWQPVRAGLWAVYTIIQGLQGTVLWISALECGHQNLSPYRAVNDSIGWMIHSSLLVPYFSF